MTLQNAMFYTYSHAAHAISELKQAGVSDDNLSIISTDTDKVYEMERVNTTLEDAGKGTTVGGALGAVSGLLAGLGLIAIPGLGPVIAAGWLASTLAGMVTGSVIGGTAGSLIGLWDEDVVTKEEADRYADHIRQGGTLVSVRGEDIPTDKIQAILTRHQNEELAQGIATYRRRTAAETSAMPH